MSLFSNTGRCVWLFLAMTAPFSIQAGITNPDLSALGQVFGRYTDDAEDAKAKEPTLSLGEAEVLLDAHLNPYFKGSFTFSAGEEGVGLEEAYATMVKGLPWGLGIKAGKYRLGFGKLNSSHPHSYVFVDPPRSLVALLPGGEEGFNETAIQVSSLLPTPGAWASLISLDLIEAKSFHPDAEWTRLGWLGRWSNNFLLGEIGALETGVSAATGKDVTPEGENAFIWGADFKAKFYLPNASQLTVLSEAILHQGHFSDSAGPKEGDLLISESRIRSQNRTGLLALVDYRFQAHVNGGFMFEQWENLESNSWDKSFRIFAGYALLEESTLLRLSYEHYMPDFGDPVNAIALQFLFSMGPHKAHQF